jgi:hypothetical protein
MSVSKPVISYPVCSFSLRDLSRYEKFSGCHAEPREASRIFGHLPKTRSFGYRLRMTLRQSLSKQRMKKQISCITNF